MPNQQHYIQYQQYHHQYRYYHLNWQGALSPGDIAVQFYAIQSEENAREHNRLFPISALTGYGDDSGCSDDDDAYDLLMVIVIMMVVDGDMRR